MLFPLAGIEVAVGILGVQEVLHHYVLLSAPRPAHESLGLFLLQLLQGSVDYLAGAFRRPEQRVLLK
jgi:hypothetical protein